MFKTWLLRESMSAQQALKMLGLKAGFTPEELKNAYKKAAMKAHPDRGGSVGDMQLVNIANDLLSVNGPISGPIITSRARKSDREQFASHEKELDAIFSKLFNEKDLDKKLSASFNTDDFVHKTSNYYQDSIGLSYAFIVIASSKKTDIDVQIKWGVSYNAVEADGMTANDVVDDINTNGNIEVTYYKNNKTLAVDRLNVPNSIKSPSKLILDETVSFFLDRQKPRINNVESFLKYIKTHYKTSITEIKRKMMVDVEVGDIRYTLKITPQYQGNGMVGLVSYSDGIKVTKISKKDYVEFVANQDNAVLFVDAIKHGREGVGAIKYITSKNESITIGVDNVNLIQEYLQEAYKFKVNALGKKRRKLKCPKGKKPNPSGTGCVTMPSTERIHRKVGSRKAVRVVKAKGIAAKTRKVRKMRKALRFRKAFGLRA